MNPNDESASERRASLQQKIARARTPRVHVTYDVETSGALEHRELPFVIGILANLSGDQSGSTSPGPRQAFPEIDVDNFDAVLEAISPRVAVTPAGESKAFPLRFSRITDFDAEAVAGQLAALSPLRDDAAEVERLNAVLHSPAFQQLEATWRGLHYLVTQTETGSALKLRVLDVSKRTLRREFRGARELDQTRLFKTLYEDEYGTFGGEPVALLIGDYEFGADTQDLEVLAGLAQLAEVAHAPFIGGASPSLLGLARFQDLGLPRDLAAIFDGPAYTRWRAFRESGEARYVALTLPRVLLRRPQRASWNGIQFSERIDDPSQLLWGNAAWAFGTCVANAFSRFGWCASIRGPEGGGLVEGLAAILAPSDDGSGSVKTCTDIGITDRREKELADLGFIPLLQAKGRDYAVFFSVPTCAKPLRYDLDVATANARLAIQLQYVLTASRFAHYLKCMFRDKIGSFMSREQCEDFLNRWIAHYVLVDDDAPSAQRAQMPLREARIDIQNIPGKPGMFRALAYLRPHYQLAELSVSLRLVVDLPRAVG